MVEHASPPMKFTKCTNACVGKGSTKFIMPNRARMSRCRHRGPQIVVHTQDPFTSLRIVQLQNPTRWHLQRRDEDTALQPVHTNSCQAVHSVPPWRSRGLDGSHESREACPLPRWLVDSAPGSNGCLQHVISSFSATIPNVTPSADSSETS